MTFSEFARNDSQFIGHNLWYLPIDREKETKRYKILCLHNQVDHKILCFLNLTFFARYYILCTERVLEGSYGH